MVLKTKLDKPARPDELEPITNLVPKKIPKTGQKLGTRDKSSFSLIQF